MNIEARLAEAPKKEAIMQLISERFGDDDDTPIPQYLFEDDTDLNYIDKKELKIFNSTTTAIIKLCESKVNAPSTLISS